MNTRRRRAGMAAMVGAAMAAAAGCTPAGAGPEAATQAEPVAAAAQDGAPAAAPAGAQPDGALAPVAVVELFTSEGCSSCPPADDVLRDLVAEASEEGGGRVLALSFHVDYWDDLGWPDPFASPRNTDRQRAYARTLGGSGLYTPQMIVGGRDGFIGSDRRRALRSIGRALSRPATARVDLGATWLAGGTALEARWSVDGAPEGATLVVALVEGGITVPVARGENGGRTLRHENVVRAFESVRLPGASSTVGAPGRLTAPSAPNPGRRDGALRLPAPARAGRGPRALVGYVQAPDLEILGAARRPLDGA